MKEHPQELRGQRSVARDAIPHDALDRLLGLRAALLVEALLEAGGLRADGARSESIKQD